MYILLYIIIIIYYILNLCLLEGHKSLALLKLAAFWVVFIFGFLPLGQTFFSAVEKDWEIGEEKDAITLISVRGYRICIDLDLCGIYSFILMFFTLHIFSGECTWFCIFIQYIVIDDDLTVIWPLTNSYDNDICDLNWMNVIQFMGKMLFVYHGLKLKRVIINASYLEFYLEYYIRLRYF